MESLPLWVKIHAVMHYSIYMMYSNTGISLSLTNGQDRHKRRLYNNPDSIPDPDPFPKRVPKEEEKEKKRKKKGPIYKCQNAQCYAFTIFCSRSCSRSCDTSFVPSETGTGTGPVVVVAGVAGVVVVVPRL